MPGMAGFGSGAASGAAAGASFGPWGAGIGAGIGGLMGLLGGSGSQFESPFSDKDLAMWAGNLYQNYLQRMTFAREGGLANALMGLGGQAGIEDMGMLGPLISQIGMNRAQGTLSGLLNTGIGAGISEAQLAGPSPASAMGGFVSSMAQNFFPPQAPGPQGMDQYTQMLMDILSGSGDPVASLEGALGDIDLGEGPPEGFGIR